MKLSTKARYGLKAILDIALYSNDETVSISEVSERTKISVNYLEQLIPKLKRAGLVSSTRGAQGRYRLAKTPSQIYVGDILRALEGDLALVNCVADESNNQCESSELCVTKYVWQRINTSINETVDSMTLEELVNQSKLINPKGIINNKTVC